MTMHWYVVHTYSGFEKSVARSLAEHWDMADYHLLTDAGTGTVLGFILLRKQFARIVSDFKKTFLKRIIHSAWPIALMGLVGAFTLNVDIIMLDNFTLEVAAQVEKLYT